MTQPRIVSLVVPDAQGTEALGSRLAEYLHGGMTVTLHGELGVGKTTLARGILRGLGWTGPVKSPTYTLVEHYPFSSLYFYHFDFYRLIDPDEWETTGFAECFRGDSLCLIEWPERVGIHLPDPDLEINLAHGRYGGRLVSMGANTDAGMRCLRAAPVLEVVPISAFR